jgi:hypothetical protein
MEERRMFSVMMGCTVAIANIVCVCVYVLCVYMLYVYVFMYVCVCMCLYVCMKKLVMNEIRM